jgi:thiol-disulfide isomerase/thioredoxin
MKKLKRIVLAAVILLSNSVLFAQKASSVEVNILNNKYKHVDLINAYGNEKKTYSSADIVNDRFVMNLNLDNDIYRFDFGDNTYMLFVVKPGENVQMTIDAENLQNIVRVSGSPAMHFVQQNSNLSARKKAVLDSLNNALQSDPDQKYWSQIAQNVNQYVQTNQDVDGYLLSVFNDIDSLNTLFRTYAPAGKIKGDADVIATAFNKMLKSLDNNYRPFNSYLENVDHYYNFTNGRKSNHSDYYQSLDRYIQGVNNRHNMAKSALGNMMEDIKKLLAERDSLAFNNLFDKKNSKSWTSKVVDLLSSKANLAAQQHNAFRQAAKDDVLANLIVTQAQQIVKDIVNGYQTQYNETDSYINSRLLESIKENKKDISVLMFLDMFPRDQNTALHEEVITALHETYPEHPIVKERWGIMHSPAYKTSVGSMAPELAFKDPDGKIRKLSDLKGKVVLIDFWASWCGPCRRENPNVRRIYGLYHDKGFEIYSVSLDRDAASWKRAISDDKLIWPNHVSDLKQWQSEGAAIYGVRSIPATFLLDREGRIVAKDLRGEALEKAVKQLVEQ